jgi:hypothetical protein
MVSAPETVYAKTSAGRVAYQVMGSGPRDVLAAKLPYLPVDLMWDEPRLVRFLNGLSSFSRHIWFDPRGTGPTFVLVEPRRLACLQTELVDPARRFHFASNDQRNPLADERARREVDG